MGGYRMNAVTDVIILHLCTNMSKNSPKTTQSVFLNDRKKTNVQRFIRRFLGKSVCFHRCLLFVRENREKCVHRPRVKHMKRPRNHHVPSESILLRWLQIKNFELLNPYKETLIQSRGPLIPSLFAKLLYLPSYLY